MAVKPFRVPVGVNQALVERRCVQVDRLLDDEQAAQVRFAGADPAEAVLEGAAREGILAVEEGAAHGGDGRSKKFRITLYPL